MTRAELLAFATRDWDSLAQSKAAYWVDTREKRGPEEALRVADGLRTFTRQVRPDWPSEDERQADLATHERVTMALRDAARTWRS